MLMQRLHKFAVHAEHLVSFSNMWFHKEYASFQSKSNKCSREDYASLYSNSCSCKEYATLHFACVARAKIICEKPLLV